MNRSIYESHLVATAVQQAFSLFPVEQALAWVKEQVELDRFQASIGIEQAAARVAAAARRIGLTGVETASLPADGSAHWWTFRAPVSWSPKRATLRIPSLAGGLEIAHYPAMPCSLAQNSATRARTHARLVCLTQGSTADDLSGAVVLVSRSHEHGSWNDIVARVEQSGALGLATDFRSKDRGAESPEQVGRLELPAGSRIFAFSVTPKDLQGLRDAAAVGLQVEVEVELSSRKSSTPLVTGVLACEGSEDEIVIMAHLCHMRPGANDNASGVAGVLSVAQVLTELTRRGSFRPRCNIRFVWGPEFVGCAAFLWARRQREQKPLAVINLDMIGEDQQMCGGSAILERSPDHVPGYVNAIMEACLTAVATTGASYSGAVPISTWSWCATPFCGASDHALFADPSIAVPAVQLGHWPDRFNHSSADTIDKVSPLEMRRCCAAAAAAVMLLSSLDAHSVSELARVVELWAFQRVFETEHGRVDGVGCNDDLVRHKLKSAEQTLVAFEQLSGNSNPTRAEQAVGRLRRIAEALDCQLPARACQELRSEVRVQRNWSGPFNLRGLLECATPADVAWLDREVFSSRTRYAWTLALVFALGESSTVQAAVKRASFSSGLEIDTAFATELVAVMLRTDWLRACLQSPPSGSL